MKTKKSKWEKYFKWGCSLSWPFFTSTKHFRALLVIWSTFHFNRSETHHFFLSDIFSKNIYQVSSGASSSFPPDSIPNQRIRYHNIIFHCSPLFLSYPYFSRPFWLHSLLWLIISFLFFVFEQSSWQNHKEVFFGWHSNCQIQQRDARISIAAISTASGIQRSQINSSLRDISISFSLNPFTSNTFFHI